MSDSHQEKKTQAISIDELRSTKVMLIDELLDILYDHDEIWIPEKQDEKLNIRDLQDIITINKQSSGLQSVVKPPSAKIVQESPETENANLSSLMKSIKSGQFLEALSESIDRILPDEHELQVKVQNVRNKSQ